tara:strand:+ start:319 stop:1077 length:759 start_codon:yes stop_codon:yes gene_type:complete
MMSEGGDRPRDIVVVADYHSHLQSTLEVAIALAGRRRLALRGLFVEDPDLAMVCSLPFTQEITLAGARPRALDQQRLRRDLEQVSRRFRRLLSEGAERASLSHSFDSVYGRRGALELGGEVEADYLVLAQPGSLRKARDQTLRIALVQADTAEAMPVLECLRSLRAERRMELLLVDGGAGLAADELLRGFVVEHAEVSCVNLPAAGPTDLYRALARGVDLVVASRHCAPWILDALLRRSTCPVILTAGRGPG